MWTAKEFVKFNDQWVTLHDNVAVVSLRNGDMIEVMRSRILELPLVDRDDRRASINSKGEEYFGLPSRLFWPELDVGL